jgi:hypothetical protein
VTSFAGGKIEAYLGPTELKGPDDLETVITGFITEAKQSLDIAVQEIDSMKVAESDSRLAGAASRWTSSSSRTTCAAS